MCVPKAPHPRPAKCAFPRRLVAVLVVLVLVVLVVLVLVWCHGEKTKTGFVGKQLLKKKTKMNTHA